MKNTKLILSTIAAAALLSACGGGGGSTTTGTSTSATVTANAAASAFDAYYQPLQTSVPVPPYAAGSRELAEFNTLNEQRAKCGFGLLSSNEQLKFAAIDQATYLDLNGSAMGAAGLDFHQQYAQYPNGFTGFTVADRAKFRGYTSNFVGEVSAGSLAEPSSARGLISAPYHAGSVLAGITEVGISAKTRVVFVLGFQSKLQRKDASILTYPCAGVTGTATKLTSETPSPYSPRNLGADPIGHPVYFFADQSVAVPSGRKSLIDVSDLMVTEDATGSAVTMLPVQSKENDTNASFLGSNFAYAAPDKPLRNLTKYRVRATVKANGVTTLVDYTFTTG